jgi:hypothetical protein
LHTWKSTVNLTQLPFSVKGINKLNGKLSTVEMKIKNDDGSLQGEAIPLVINMRSNRWIKDNPGSIPVKKWRY